MDHHCDPVCHHFQWSNVYFQQDVTFRFLPRSRGVFLLGVCEWWTFLYSRKATLLTHSLSPVYFSDTDSSSVLSCTNTSVFLLLWNSKWLFCKGTRVPVLVLSKCTAGVFSVVQSDLPHGMLGSHVESKPMSHHQQSQLLDNLGWN